MTATEDILTLEDSTLYIRGHYHEMFPSTKPRRTMGHLPVELHKDLFDYAQKHNLKMYEVIAGLWDFYSQYELENETQLKTQRAKNKRK